jgi:thioredoxin 1
MERIVLNSDIPVLVDFWAEQCGPWRMVGPAVEQLAQSMEGNIKVSKLNLTKTKKLQ